MSALTTVVEDGIAVVTFDLPGELVNKLSDPVIRAQAGCKQLDLLGLGLDPPRRAKLAILDDRDLTEIQVHVQRHRPHRNHLP